jgi:hypothetical protein
MNSNKNENTLAATWSQVTSLLECGFSIIPVRDKPEGGRPAKSPYPSWKRYQTDIITPSDLWTQMAEKFNTTAIAVVCGKVSGNLEVIDIDVKYKPGIDAKIFGDIQLLYPDLWRKLRVHRSPSGGFHILYRIIEQPPPGNKKLAKRPTTVEDNTKQKHVSFIETRGEGGIVLMPPSLGYSVFKPEPIPQITLSERNALISICTERTEIITIEQPPKPSRKDDSYYDENPFDHFNKSQAGAEVLVELGWQKHRSETNDFAWYTRPGSQSGERHATFLKRKNVFWFWTTNTELENEKAYTPSSVLTNFRFNGDYKIAYRDLVQRGFGRIKPSTEARLIRSGSLAPNLSPEAQVASTKLVEARTELHPHGIFWEFSPEGDKALINREALYKAAEGLGFRLWNGEIYRLSKGFLFKSNEREFQDVMKCYIQEPDPIAFDTIINTYEHFLQLAGKFSITRLALLDESKLLLDRKDCSYKFYSDCFIRITENDVEQFDYSDLGDKIILQDKVMDRKFNVKDGGVYKDFLEKSLGYSKIESYVNKIIGYLAHEYKDETTAYIIVLTEQCPDPKNGGGSGKNLFCNLFRHTTTITNRPGGQIHYDEKFFQSWRGQKLFSISDVPKDFNFLFLKDITSNSAVMKKLFKDEDEVDVEKLPKIIVNTNYSYEIADGGLKRRIIPLEFTDFFTRCGGVKVHFGKFFPTDWSEDDWAGYDYIMIKGIQEWLQSKLVLESTVLTFGGWKKQFEQVYGHYTADFIYENFDDWKNNEFISNALFKANFDDWLNDKGVSKLYHPSSIKVNKAIEDYAARMNVSFNAQAQRREMGAVVKGKSFSNGDETPF